MASRTSPATGARINRAGLGISPFQARLTGPENASLAAELTCDEIKEAIWATHPTKASGPDGLHMDSLTRIVWLRLNHQ